MALVAVLAACSHNSMAIEVATSDSSVKRVELVLVQSTCDSCTSDAPPGWPLTMAAPTGSVYYQVPGDRFTANVDGGVAGFTLEPGSDDYLLRLGAIGFDAQGVPKGIVFVDRDFHIKQHLGEVIQLELATRDIQQVSGPTSGLTIGSNDSVVVWRAPNAPDTAESCVAVLGDTNSFVVPAADQDCDGITGAAECDPFWYKYAKPASPVPQYCLEQPSVDKPCMVGTETSCVDGQSQAGCHPNNVCVPQQACTDCTDPTDPQCIDHVGNDSAMAVPRVHCTIPLVGMSGNFMACPTGIAPVNIDQPFSGGGACNPSLIKAPVTFPVTSGSSVAFDTGQGSVSLTIANPVSPCEFQIIPMASVSSIPSHSVPALVVLHGPTRDLLVPLVVDFTNANTTVCSGALTAASCTVDAATFADPFWTCAKN